MKRRNAKERSRQLIDIRSISSSAQAEFGELKFEPFFGNKTKQKQRQTRVIVPNSGKKNPHVSALLSQISVLSLLDNKSY